MGIYVQFTDSWGDGKRELSQIDNPSGAEILKCMGFSIEMSRYKNKTSLK